MLDCLSSTIRSQSFALSQRFNPAHTSWLYFMPLPSVGLQPSELFLLGQPYSLSGTVTLLPLKLARTAHWETRLAIVTLAEDHPV